MKLKEEICYIRKANLVWNALDEEMVIIDPENGFVHLLNKTGAYIFELLECSISKNELYDKIQFKCDISPDKMKNVKSEIDNYIIELLDNNLILEVSL